MIEDFDKNLFKKCMPFFGDSPVIFDIGAHKGSYTDFVKEVLPSAKCYLFEPNIDLYAKLKNKYEIVYPLAICESTGFKTFHVCPKKNDELSSLYKRSIFDETGYESIKVRCASVDSLSIQHDLEQIDFIKIDVEGAEKDVIVGCAAMMHDKKIKFIQFEYGSTYLDAEINFTDILKVSAVFGYKTYELVNNTLTEVTEANFINDYRYSVFLLTYIKCS